MKKTVKAWGFIKKGEIYKSYDGLPVLFASKTEAQFNGKPFQATITFSQKRKKR